MTPQWDDVKSKYFWSSDPECSQYKTRFLVRGSLPTRALVSYPGSGNTWTRYQRGAVLAPGTTDFTLHGSRYPYAIKNQPKARNAPSCT